MFTEVQEKKEGNRLFRRDSKYFDTTPIPLDKDDDISDIVSFEGF